MFIKKRKQSLKKMIFTFIKAMNKTRLFMLFYLFNLTAEGKVAVFKLFLFLISGIYNFRFEKATKARRFFF